MNRPLPAIKELTDLRKKITTSNSLAYAADIGGQTIKHESSSIENIQVSCVSEDYDKVRNFEIEDGRFFTESEFEIIVEKTQRLKECFINYGERWFLKEIRNCAFSRNDAASVLNLSTLSFILPGFCPLGRIPPKSEVMIFRFGFMR